MALHVVDVESRPDGRGRDPRLASCQDPCGDRLAVGPECRVGVVESTQRLDDDEMLSEGPSRSKAVKVSWSRASAPFRRGQPAYWWARRRRPFCASLDRACEETRAARSKSFIPASRRNQQGAELSQLTATKIKALAQKKASINDKLAPSLLSNLSSDVAASLIFGHLETTQPWNWCTSASGQ